MPKKVELPQGNEGGIPKKSVFKILHKDRPSDEKGAIVRQPGFERVPFTGSRQMARNTQEDKRKGLTDFALPKLKPLIVQKKEIKTGEEAKLLRDTLHDKRKGIRQQLQEYRSVPNNPRKKELLKMDEQTHTTIKKITAFLNQWTNLDQDWYLEHLINSKDELASQAKVLLRFRDTHRGKDFTPEERSYHEVLSGRIRDTLMTRIREKQRGKK